MINIYISKFCILGKDIIHQLHINLYRFFIGLLGSVFFVQVLYKIFQYKNNKLILETLCKSGQNSIGIYIISVSVINKILLRVSYNLQTFNILSLLIESFLVFVLSYLCTLAIKNNKVANAILLGGRI